MYSFNTDEHSVYHKDSDMHGLKQLSTKKVIFDYCKYL